MNRHVSGASVDIVFNKVKTHGRRTINFDQFKAALLVRLAVWTSFCASDYILIQVDGHGHIAATIEGAFPCR